MIKIFLDPGHGGRDSGARANGIEEKNIALAITKRIGLILMRDYRGVSVKMSRTNDQTISLKKRTDDANRWGADFYLSIHINAGGGRGYEDYIFRKLLASSYTAKLREQIHSEIMKLSNMSNRGKKKANFHVLRESKMPALLTENGFIDNPSDAAKMKQDSWLDDIAAGHVNGIVNAFGLIKKTCSSSITYIKIIAHSLWTYHSPNWRDRAVIVNKGEIFTVIKDQFSVDAGFMYQIKSGLYITASKQYVEVYQL